MEAPITQWFPVASSSDLPPRHVYHGQLHGHELAIWRDDAGAVNIWENRCLHRGVRLSIGHNLGNELRCQYHGWRYQSGSANCTYIPAHPANAPARTIRNRTYPAIEREGLIWTSLSGETAPPALLQQGAGALPLRPIPVNAPAASVREALDGYGDAPVRFYVQPVSNTRAVIRGVLTEVTAETDALSLLRRHNAALTALREQIEAVAPSAQEAAAEIPLSLPVLAAQDAGRPLDGGAIRVRVARKFQAAEDVAAFRLEPVTGPLPPAPPGAHIDLRLPDGKVRQYSLVNGPGDDGFYLIGVKREPNSRGGSAALHDTVREGDLLAVSAPHDNFRPALGAARHLLIAGGIGITPLLSLAKTLHRAGETIALHVFARTQAHAAFPEQLAALGEAAQIHTGLDPAATLAQLQTLLAARSDDAHLYLCGPGPMLEAARLAAEQAGWPENAIHFEYFANDQAKDDSASFEVALARSAFTVTIPSGRSITDVLREHGVVIPTSCEQGACGTCLTTVIDGIPDHQDVFLSKAERAANTCLTPCISRAKSARLVLDI